MEYENAENSKRETEAQCGYRDVGTNRTVGLSQDYACPPVQPSSSIGWAIKQMWHGIPVRRRGWNGRGMHIALQTPDLGSKMTQPYVYMKTADGNLVPWLCSQTDLLAMDWEAATV